MSVVLPTYVSNITYICQQTEMFWRFIDAIKLQKVVARRI